MSRIIKVTNHVVEVLIEDLEHRDAINYIKDNYSKYSGEIEGITFDQVLPSDDSQEYIGIDGDSLIFAISHPTYYQSNQYLQLIYKDGSLEDLFDQEGNKLYGTLN